MNLKKVRKSILIFAGLLSVLGICASALLFTRFASSADTAYIYIDGDDDIDSVRVKLSPYASFLGRTGFSLASRMTGYGPSVKPGKYDVGGGVNTLALVRRLRAGRQSEVRLTIPTVWTMEHLAARLSEVMMTDSATWAACFNDTAFCGKYGYTPATLPCLFLTDTYQVYWTDTPERLAERLKKASDNYWTKERKAAASRQGLSENEVITLASIVDRETAAEKEKPMVAGMYLNRLREPMPLQADPTVKFALKDFGLRRILHEHLRVDNPYNTYRNEGLPPGPISLPSRSSIEAVLHPAGHKYLYMCAKEDFSGTHNFAVTY